MLLENSSVSSRKTPLLIVISGSSGVGKDATLVKMRESGFVFHYVVTATTRKKRPSEIEGQDYLFISKEKFNLMVKDEEFLEWAEVYGNYYGVPKKGIREALERGYDVIAKVDVQGAATIKRVLPDAVFIFLLPPSLEELADRLNQRGDQSSHEIALRLSETQKEMESLSLFDYAVVSYKDNLDLTVAQINAIIIAEKCRVKPRLIELK